MTLYRYKRNRTFVHGATLDSSARRTRTWTWLAMVVFVTSFVSNGGVAATNVAAQPNEDVCWLPVNQNTRSIQLIESKEAPVAISEDDTLPPLEFTTSWRSILLIEGLPLTAPVADDDALPALELTPSWRSILLIESKEAPVESASSDC